MSSIPQITLNINGKEVKGKAGDTVLDVCRANDIYVPTLCFLEGLSNVGACRMCVVEIEGERRINPACTYPARDGLIVRTHTETLEKYRRQILELLFTERNHFCFFCAASGDCELQQLAYDYQMDHARYPYTFPSLQADTLNDYLVMDHNRCILCGRCVRACGEIVGNNTLDFGRRGWRTLITADLNQPLGQSTCISCGACAQACPTGAIFSKVSAYRGRFSEGRVSRSLCTLCGLGCEIQVLVRDNNIVRIDGVDLTGDKGQLCRRGRFEQINPKGQRITVPLVQDRSGRLKEASWDEALDMVAGPIGEHREKSSNRMAGFASSLCPNETLAAFSRLMVDTSGAGHVDTLDGDAYRVLARGIRIFSNHGRGLEIESELEAILNADCVVVAGANPVDSHPVAGSFIFRSANRNGSKLLLIDSRPNSFGFRADLRLRPREGSEEELFGALTSLVSKKGKGGKRFRGVSLERAADSTGLNETVIKQAAAMLAGADRPVIVYGEGILAQREPKLVARLLDLAEVAGNGKLQAVSLKPRGNSRGAWQLGIASEDGIGRTRPRLVYVLLSDDSFEGGSWVSQVEQAEFLVVQASYRSPLTDCANVVIPSPIWSERGGSYVSLDGKVGRCEPLLKPPEGIRDDTAIFAELTRRIRSGHKS